MSQSYTTLADELEEHAEAARDYFRNLGYTVAREKTELGFPYTPTLLCSRKATTITVLVEEHYKPEKLALWTAYVRSSSKDLRVAVWLPGNLFNPEQEGQLRADGIGLYITGTPHTEKIIPKDLALNFDPPPLNSLNARKRAALGAAYEQIGRGQWREGFLEACRALEVAARSYLKLGSKRGRIVIQTRKGASQLTSAQIDRLTMGQLAEKFSKIQNQNKADSIIGLALKRLNPDRVLLTHGKGRGEVRIRRNVGRNMWIIVSAFDHL